MYVLNEEVRHFIGNFAVAGITAALAKTVCAPFERIKLILQTQDSVLQILSGERKQYKGIIDCFIRIPKEQGIWSLWRGNGVSIIRYFPTQALNFAFNDFFKKRFYILTGTDSHAKSTFATFVAGGLAGAWSTTLTYPLEFCQTRVSVDIGSDSRRSKDKVAVKREFKGLKDCFSQISKVDGAKGLYKGYFVCILGVTIYRAFYFGLFDAVKKLWANKEIHSQQDAPKPPLYLGLFFAQLVTTVSGAISYPLDTVGRRLMMEAGRPKNTRLFYNTTGAFITMYKYEGGLKTFYKGLGANCLRGLSGALVLVTYDEVLHYTKWKQWFST